MSSRILIPVFVALALSACGKPEAAAPVEKARPVVVAAVERGDVQVVVTAIAQARPAMEAWLTAEVGGRVVGVAREGTFFSRGSLLLEVDAERATAVRDAARARIARAAEDLAQRRRTFDRLDRLASEGAVSREDRDAAASAVAMAESALAAERAGERDLAAAAAKQRVSAPFDGWVLERMVEVGEVVGPAARALRFGDLAHLEIEARVPEAAALSVKPGDSAVVRFEAIAGETFTAVVERIDRALDPISRTAGVVFRLANPGTRLPAGLMARVEIRSGVSTGALAVPVAALLSGPEGDYAWVVVGDRAERRPVRVGLRGGENAEVLEGLSEGDLVVVRGEEVLMPGVLVAPTRD